ncbi:MAG: hypothetical protein IPH97_06370 [Ignavibacteriales bacterium]|nr:hypothetical protein [Ignavibacteriales bacterium]
MEWFSQPQKLSPQSIKDYKSDLLEIFIAIFINEFIILYSKNINRRYEQYEENQHFIRGKILFSETIRRNPILRHLHYVRYDDFTVNNPMNQIFKALILKLLKRTKSLENKKNLVIGLTFLQDVELKNLNLAIFNQVQFDRLNTQYEKLFNLARLFFHNLQPGLSIGKENTFSFLVPIHLLFENFVAKIIESLSDEHFIFEYHKQNLYLGYLGTKQVFNLNPILL